MNGATIELVEEFFQTKGVTGYKGIQRMKSFTFTVDGQNPDTPFIEQVFSFNWLARLCQMAVALKYPKVMKASSVK